MLAWPHSGCHVHDGVWVAADDREFAVRLARYCARNPVALSRLDHQSDNATVTSYSDKPMGPTAGSETLDVLEFLARVASHIPNKGQVLQRYYGRYSSRVRGMRRKAGYAEHQPVVPGRARARPATRDRPTVGRVAAAYLRGGPVGMPTLWPTDAHCGVHHRAPRDRPHPRSPMSYRSYEEPCGRTAPDCWFGEL